MDSTVIVKCNCCTELQSLIWYFVVVWTIMYWRSISNDFKTECFISLLSFLCRCMIVPALSVFTVCGQ